MNSVDNNNYNCIKFLYFLLLMVLYLKKKKKIKIFGEKKFHENYYGQDEFAGDLKNGILNWR